ncbi:MAG: glycosyltransferase family 4 protein [Chitinophagaceae bacterium]|nr:glycosyltransferase family 4 protein [Chitinophagaceae bacterium]
MLHPGALKQKASKKKWFIKAFNLVGFPKRVAFHATDKQEASYIRSQFGNKSAIFIAGNISSFIGKLPSPIKPKNELKLLTIALISPMKNYLKVLNALRNVSLSVTYNIYGAVKDEGYLAQCKSVAATLPPNIEVGFHGELPPDRISATLEEHHVFILPSESENFGHAIYEALSAGRPVITSHNTPWNHLEENHAGLNVNPEIEMEISKAIHTFGVMDNVSFVNECEAAFQYALGYYKLDEILVKYKTMFDVNL